MKNNKLDPNNESHWITHAEHEARRGSEHRAKLTRWTNPSLWALLTQHGAPKPKPTDSWWNDWAANNPQGAALGLSNVNICESMMNSLKGIVRGARPIEKD